MKVSRETFAILLGLFVGLSSALAVPRYTPPPLPNIVPISRGGTNSTATPTSGGIAYGDGTAYQFSSAGTAGQCLQSNGTGAPTWGSCGTGGSGITYAEVVAASLAGF